MTGLYHQPPRRPATRSAALVLSPAQAPAPALVLALVLALAALVVMPASPAAAVVGGSQVPVGQRAYTASLQDRGSTGADGHFCGATVVARWWALTAGHCVTGRDGSLTRAGTLQVVTGRTVLSDASRGRAIGVRRVLRHPAYESAGTDVALLRLARPARAPRAALPGARSRRGEADGTDLVVTGWGSQSFLLPLTPDHLRQVTVPVVGDQRCGSGANALGGFTADDELCAGGFGADSCQGDSGGPLVLDRSGRRPLLVGVVSHGLGCATPTAPGVYAEVGSPRVARFLARHLPARVAPRT